MQSQSRPPRKGVPPGPPRCFHHLPLCLAVRLWAHAPRRLCSVLHLRSVPGRWQVGGPVLSSLQRAGRGQVRADAWWFWGAGTPESQPPPWRHRVVSGARTRWGKLGSLSISTGMDPPGPACRPHEAPGEGCGCSPILQWSHLRPSGAGRGQPACTDLGILPNRKAHDLGSESLVFLSGKWGTSLPGGGAAGGQKSILENLGGRDRI